MAKVDEKDHDYLFKLLIIGNSAVGKSALLMRFAGGTYEDNYITTIGIDFKVRTIEVDEKRIKMQIWDTAGQERFRTIGTAYYRNTHGVIVVYDVTSRESFLNVEQWLKEIKQNCDRPPTVVLVGNKDDNAILKKVHSEEATEFAAKIGVPLFETSAKENINVDEMFYEVAKMMVNTRLTKTLARNNAKETSKESKSIKPMTRKISKSKKDKGGKQKCLI